MKQLRKYAYGVNLRYNEWQSRDGGYTVYSVYGEDPNTDMGGSHITPFLGNVEGTFTEVLEYAANNMSRFYAWGGGGHVVPYSSLNESSEPVVLNQAKPVYYSKNIVKYPSILLEKGYSLYTTNDTYSLYYLHSIDERIKVKHIWQISIILIIKKQMTDYYDQSLHNEISKLETTFQKKEFPQKYMILAFKEYEIIDDQAIHDIGEIVSYKTNRHAYVQINVGLTLDTKKAYFLYSDTYYPTYYYKDAVDLIFELIGTKRHTQDKSTN